MLYVALTRPREQLHIFFPVMEPDKYGNFSDKAETVGQMLFQLFDMQERYQSVTSEDELPEPISICFGRYDGPEKQSVADEGTLSIADAPTSEYRMRLKLSSRRYSEALTSGKLTPQDEGIVLHGVVGVGSRSHHDGIVAGRGNDVAGKRVVLRVRGERHGSVDGVAGDGAADKITTIG